MGTMKRICIFGSTTWVALATCSVAAAADLPVSYPVKAPPAATDYDWTGFYVGGHIGLATGNSGWTLDPPGGGAPVAGMRRAIGCSMPRAGWPGAMISRS